jgi:predicted nucleic acid-binding protein
MRVLLDTNIIIHREASKIVNEDIGILFYWLDKLNYVKCVHPLTINELNRNVNSDTVKVMQIKLAAYHLLKTQASVSDEVKEISLSVDKTPNDLDDTKLLNEVFAGRVDILISEDKKIHFKARLLGIADRVFRIDSFLEKVISENPEFVNYKVLSVKKDFFGNVDLQDRFFDSFRSDYVGFDKWFNGKSDETAYLCYNNGELSAFLYLKCEDTDENYHNIKPIFEPRKRLKIGTLKVTSNGFKLGERFLKIVFDNARQYHVDEIYVTIFDKRPEQLRLISLLEEFGFKYYGEKNSASGLEKVYVRYFNKNASLAQPRLTYPWLSKTANVFIVPIRPEYHTNLLPDSILRTESPQDFVDNEPYRNAISKAYVSHSLNRDIKTGDVLVFYRSGGIYKGVATTIGIVESINDKIASLEELIQICRKRTVLTREELTEYWQRNPRNRPFVVNFLYTFSFKRRLTLKEMLDKSLLPSMDSVKTITKIDWAAFKQLISLSQI